MIPDGSPGPWVRPIMWLSLVFGIAALAWNALRVYLLISAAETVEPTTVIGILISTGTGVVLILNGLAFRQRSKG